jgi:hypothetical protein
MSNTLNIFKTKPKYYFSVHYCDTSKCNCFKEQSVFFTISLWKINNEKLIVEREGSHVALHLQQILKSALNCSLFFDFELVPELIIEEKSKTYVIHNKNINIFR